MQPAGIPSPCPGTVWDVVGGADKGGIVVRKECDLNSEPYEQRLVFGAKIKGLVLQGTRLHYELLTGSGPAEGWVSLANSEKRLVQPAANRPTLSLDRILLRHESSGTFEENYEVDKELGEGAFASVFIARNKITGQTRAIKRLPCSKLDELQAIDAECRTLVRLTHPYVMKFYEFYREPRSIYLVTELCLGGTFTEFFRHKWDLDSESYCKWDIEDARILFQQVLSAIRHCHKLRVLHHDLKPENCLILGDTGRPDDYQTDQMQRVYRGLWRRPLAKLIDFGIATLMKMPERPEFSTTLEQGEDQIAPDLEGFDLNDIDCGFGRRSSAPAKMEAAEQDEITKLTGSAFWRAPEVFDPDATSGAKADMFSMGLIMFCCLTSVQPLHHGSWLPPLGAKESMDAYDNMPLELLDYPMEEFGFDKGYHIPEEARDLIIGLLEKDKHKRLSAADAVNHPWFDFSVRAEKVYPEQQVPSKWERSRQVSYSCLSDLGSSDASPGCSPKTSPKHSPRGSPFTSPFSSPRRQRSTGEPILEEAPDQVTPVASAAPMEYLCPAFHVLKSFETDEDGYSCSRCEGEFPQASTLHGCRVCDFDACTECLKSLQARKTIGGLLNGWTRSPSPKRRVRAGVVIPPPRSTFTTVKDRTPSPKSPKDRKFRQKRLRRGSVQSALLLDRVLRYKDLPAWHCVVLRLIAHNSHETEVSKLRERFFNMDKNKSGAVSRDELRSAMDENGMVINEDQLQGIFLNLDSQGTGEIEYNEWIASTLAPSIVRQEEVIKMVFDFFDTRHVGCVGLDELKVLLGPDNAQAMLARAGVTEFDMHSFMKLMKIAAAD